MGAQLIPNSPVLLPKRRRVVRGASTNRQPPVSRQHQGGRYHPTRPRQHEEHLAHVLWCAQTIVGRDAIRIRIWMVSIGHLGAAIIPAPSSRWALLPAPPGFGFITAIFVLEAEHSARALHWSTRGHVQRRQYPCGHQPSWMQLGHLAKMLTGRRNLAIRTVRTVCLGNCSPMLVHFMACAAEKRWSRRVLADMWWRERRASS